MNQQQDQAPLGDLVDRTVVDSHGDKVGKVFDVYLDEGTDQPEWLAVSSGIFGNKISFVPIAGVGYDDEGNVAVAYDKHTIKDAPRAEADGQLSEEEERALYAHYGRSYEQPTSGQATEVADRRQPAAGAGDTSVVRSEEELSVDKHRREAGRVKLRKWVETEDVHLTVPVQRQMARIVREPVGPGERVDDLTEGDEEIVLSEETVDVSKRIVAKERVGIETETVTEQVPVDETIRKERVEVEGDDLIDRRGDAR